MHLPAFETVEIVSHEMFGRMSLRHLLGADPTTALGWNQPHDVIYRVDVGSRALVEVRVTSQVR